MRKMLKDKKGFTLVELMIVVVIMGILVAVAVPVYNSVTKNAKTKTCTSNMQTIKSTMTQYQMSGNAGDEVAWATLATAFDGTKAYSTFPADFTNLFTDGVPVCPSDAGEGNKEYKIKVAAGATADDVGTITVACQSADAATHNG